jgi:hypothetical protein
MISNRKYSHYGIIETSTVISRFDDDKYALRGSRTPD